MAEESGTSEDGDSGETVVSYHAYIQSPEWKARAAHYKKLAGNRCRVCNTSDEILDAHHRTYERLGNEWDDDITVLCRTCHGLYERHKQVSRLDEGAIQRWLAAIRQWRKFFYGLVVAQAEAIEVSADSVRVLFRPCHDALLDQFKLKESDLAEIFRVANGRSVSVSGGFWVSGRLIKAPCR